VARVAVVEDIQQGVGVAEERTGVEALGVYDGAANEGKVGPVDEGHAVE